MKKFLLLMMCLTTAKVFAQAKIPFNTQQNAAAGAYTPKISLGGISMKQGEEGKSRYYMPDTAVGTDYFFSTGSADVFSTTTDEIKCHQNMATGDTEFNRQLKKLGSPFVELMCNEAQRIKVTKELNPGSCMMLANCFKNRSSLGDGTLDILIKAKQKTASEAIALMSQTTIQEMLDLEELKAYAREKYDSDFMPKECKEESPLALPTTGSGCMSKIVDQGFELAQKTCRAVEDSCHPDYLEFVKDKKTEDSKNSLMAEFIKEKAKLAIKIPIEEDMVITQEISQIIYRGTESPEEKTKKVIKYLRENYSKLDPVYKNYLKQSLAARSAGKEDPIEKGLVKYITLNQKKNPLEMMIELETLRREEAHKILRENCKSSMTMPKLCGIVTDVINGAEVAVPEESFNRLLKRRDSSPSISINMKDSNMNDVKMTKQEIADNISRCNTFVLDKPLVKAGVASVRLSGGMDLFSDSSMTGMFAFKANPTGIYGISVTGGEQNFKAQIVVSSNGAISRKEALSSAPMERITSSVAEKEKDSIFTTKFSNNQVMDVSYRRSDSRLTLPKVTEKAESTDFSKGYVSSKDDAVKAITGSAEVAANMGMVNQQQAMANQRAMITTPRTTDTFIEPINDIQSKTESSTSKAASGNVDYNQLLSKIAGLEDKLAQAQKKGGEKAADITADAKPSEESELIKELRNAKNTLSSFNKTQVDATHVETAATSSNTRRQKERSIEAEEEENVSDAPIVAAASSSGSSSSRGSSSSAAPASSSNRGPASVASRSDDGGEETKSSSRGPVLTETTSAASGNDIVLTRLDGVSNVKASETINKLIMSESGKPFYIEEGGLVKQIIPQIVDGKVLTDENGDPIYKTVVKGKVGEFKGDKDKKEKQKVVVKAASPADVKKQDEQAAPAVRYSELQELVKLKK